MNTLNLPFPVMFLAYGTEGLFAATLFYIPNVLLTYSLGLFIASKKHWREGIKEVFRIPPIYAALTGLLLNLFDVTVPQMILRPLDFISMMAIPLILLVLGHNLSRAEIASVPTTLLASFLRMGIGFLFGLLAVYIFNLTGLLRTIVILDSAMPAAVMSSLLTKKYDNEANLVSSVVLITTVISVFTIPLLLRMLV
jgi:predicted permease